MESSPNPPDPSVELLQRWQEEGDPDALNELLQLEIGVLKHMIRARDVSGIGGSVSTSDLAQEAVLGLLKAKTPPTFTNPRALRGYLWKSAWHLMAKRYEKRQQSPGRLDFESLPGFEAFLKHAPTFSRIDHAERSMAIGLAMGLLAPEDAHLIRQIYFEEKTIAEAAAAIGLGRDVANTRLVRARRNLAARLSQWAEIIG